MENIVNWIAYYRELLIKAVPENSSSISQCVLKGWLHGLGNHLEIDSMRIYLFDYRSNKILIHQVYGDNELWRDVDITKLRREKAKYKKLFFVKIRHIRENGQFLLLGYLGFHTEKYVSNDMMSSLDVLCMLYGNYILKYWCPIKNIFDSSEKGTNYSASPQRFVDHGDGVFDTFFLSSIFGLFRTRFRLFVQVAEFPLLFGELRR